MLLDDYIEVSASCRNKPYYEAKGYEIPHYKDKKGREVVKKGTKIKVKIFDAQPFTNVNIRYKCDDCDDEKSVKYYTMFSRDNSQFSKTGETVCSTCANKRMKGANNPKYKHGNNRFCEYRSNAKKRGHSFELSVEEFELITSKECYYCGGCSKSFKENSRGNGIDRVDSSVGYILDNCVASCFRCNFLKNTMSHDEFLSHIENIYKRHFA